MYAYNLPLLKVNTKLLPRLILVHESCSYALNIKTKIKKIFD